jgi:hypothetical protein
MKLFNHLPSSVFHRDFPILYQMYAIPPYSIRCTESFFVFLEPVSFARRLCTDGWQSQAAASFDLPLRVGQTSCCHSTLSPSATAAAVTYCSTTTNEPSLGALGPYLLAPAWWQA